MKNIYEIFDDFEKASTKEEKVNVLRRNKNWALTNILRGTFDPRVDFSVKNVKYKPSDAPAGLGYTSIHQELGRAYLFEVNNPRVDPNLSQARKEQLLIQILESLEKREAEIYINMLNKRQDVKGLNAKIVKEAFPDLLP